MKFYLVKDQACVISESKTIIVGADLIANHGFGFGCEVEKNCCCSKSLKDSITNQGFLAEHGVFLEQSAINSLWSLQISFQLMSPTNKVKIEGKLLEILNAVCGEHVDVKLVAVDLQQEVPRTSGWGSFTFSALEADRDDDDLTAPHFMLAQNFERRPQLQPRSSNGGGSPFGVFGQAEGKKYFSTSEMKITLDPKDGFICKEDSLSTSPSLMNVWGVNRPLSAKITVEVNVPNRNMMLAPTVNYNINKKILMEGVAADIAIVAKNGKEIKCHKNFLYAHSPVFEPMLEGSMEEAKTSKIPMPDTSEEGVHAFLAYLYCRDTQKAIKDFTIAFELLKAGHMYLIESLLTTMKHILLNQPNDKYSVDDALELFCFSRSHDADLKMKAVQVLKLNLQLLETSENFATLFQKDADAARELCLFAFSV